MNDNFPSWLDDPNDEDDSTGNFDWLQDLNNDPSGAAPQKPLDVGKPPVDDPFDFDALSTFDAGEEPVEDNGDWLGDLSDNPFDMKPTAPADDDESDALPAWLRTKEGMPSVTDLMQASADAAEAEEGLPEWLRTDDSLPMAGEVTPPTKAVSSDDIPPWLRGTDLEDLPDDEDDLGTDDHGALPIWLQQADDLGAADANAFQASFDDLEFEVEETESEGMPAFDASLFDTGNLEPEVTSAPVEDMAWLQDSAPTGSADDNFTDLDSLLAESGMGDDADALLASLLTTTPDEPDAAAFGSFFAPEDAQAEDDNTPDFSSLFAEEPAASAMDSGKPVEFGQLDDDFDFDAPLDYTPELPEIDEPDAPQRMTTQEFQGLFDGEDITRFDSGRVDFNALLGSDPLSRPGGAEMAQGQMPDFLRDVSVGDVSAAAMMRQQQDTPLEDLPPELRALLDESVAATSASSVASSPMSALIPSAPKIQSAAPIGLTESQRKSADLLRAAAAATGASEPAARVKPVRRRFSYNIPRLLVALIVAAAVALPLIDRFDMLRFTAPPPVVFDNASAAQAAYLQLDKLQPGQLELIAVDASAGSLSELREALSGVVLHAVQREAVPFIVSTDPVTLVAVDRLLSDLLPETRGQAYIVGRYVAGDTLGIRGLAENTLDMFAYDSDGQPTGLRVESLAEFGAVVVLSDRADGVRAWSEQIAPYLSVPPVFVVSASAAPLARVYADALNAPLLVGLGDGMTYISQLGSQMGEGGLIPFGVTPSATSTQTSTPTHTPTETPTPNALQRTATTDAMILAGITPSATPTDTPTNTPTATFTPSATPTNTLTPTNTSTPTNTLTPSRTPTPSVTPLLSPTPTDTVEPTATSETASGATAVPSVTVTAAATAAETPTPTATQSGDEQLAFVKVNYRVNVRSGPGEGFPAVGSAGPEEPLVVLGLDTTGLWVNVRLENGVEGWIVKRLVDIEGETGLPVVLNGEMRVGAGASQQIAGVQDAADRRWHGITTGVIVSAVLITLGMLIGVVRGLARRRR